MTANNENVNNFYRIPQKMREWRQWCCWRLEAVPGRKKAAKIPYDPKTGQRASVTDRSTWASFEDAVAASPQFDGIGFVLTNGDPCFCVDLDETDDKAEFERQKGIYERFNTWTERSYSRKGAHLWGYGAVPSGKRRGNVEVYSDARFIAMTGDVINNRPLKDCQELLTQLWSALGGEVEPEQQQACVEPPTMTDEQVIDKARNAANGALFEALFKGEWENRYPSQSEADFAFIDMVAFFSENKQQIIRIFHQSQLGQRKKAKRNDYLEGMLSKVFDRLPPPIDFTEFKKSVAEDIQKREAQFAIVTYDSISDEEWTKAKLSPEPIIENSLYSGEVAVLIAQGGSGKTTYVVLEAIHIILKLDFCGKRILKSGAVVILTGEDSRERIIGIARTLSERMNLPEWHVQQIKKYLHIIDVRGHNFRLCRIKGDMVCSSENVDKLVEKIKPLKPVLLNIDPAISFGIGESRVNDSEQGLIVAARYICNHVECCVRFIHHTGKRPAQKDVEISQYDGRGGSTMPDGARMVTVLKRLETEEWFKQTGSALPEGSEGLLLAFPKLSFTARQPNIYLERTGFSYKRILPKRSTEDEKIEVGKERIIEFLRKAEEQAHFHNKETLEANAKKLEMSRDTIRAVLALLEMEGVIEVTKRITGKGNCVRLTGYSRQSSASEKGL